MEWNSSLYDNAQGYVSMLGKELIEYIPKKDNLSVLDLGCGTGDLTHEIKHRLDANIIGVDYSDNMIKEAVAKYSSIDFFVCDACNLPFECRFDVVFSNAVFHWITDQDGLHRSIKRALKPGGLLVCEFGADRNIDCISSAFAEAAKKYNYNYQSRFYFPTVSQHTKVLENSDFGIDKIYDFDRPTTLPNAQEGLRQWVQQFFSTPLENFCEEEKEEIFLFMEKRLAHMFDGAAWTADYRRLRVIAHA